MPSSRNAFQHRLRAKEIDKLQPNPERLAQIIEEHALDLNPTDIGVIKTICVRPYLQASRSAPYWDFLPR